MLGLVDALTPVGVSDLVFIAPQAVGYSWYPYSFLAPLAQNEPYLSRSLGGLGRALAVLEGAGIPAERVVLLGFSQGACLALEYAARYPRRYGGLVGFSGGLIGPPGTVWTVRGSLEGSPVFLGCSDIDPHIPLLRVHETSQALERIDGLVTERIYPGMGHTINDDEIAFVRAMIAQL
jgi:predicted esterase